MPGSCDKAPISAARTSRRRSSHQAPISTPVHANRIEVPLARMTSETIHEEAERGVGSSAEITQHGRELRQHHQDEEQHHADRRRAARTAGIAWRRSACAASPRRASAPLPALRGHDRACPRLRPRASRPRTSTGNRSGCAATASAKLSPPSTAIRNRATTGRSRPTSESSDNSSSASSSRAPAFSNSARSRVKVVTSAADGRLKLKPKLPAAFAAPLSSTVSIGNSRR